MLIQHMRLSWAWETDDDQDDQDDDDDDARESKVDGDVWAS